MTEAILRINDVYKKFWDGQNEVNVLHGISFTINQGDFVSIIGPSGSGKSTLLTICGGLQEPSSGRIIFQNLDLYHQSKEALTEFRQKYVGFVFQQMHLIPYLTALENIMLPLIPQKIGKEEQLLRAKTVLDHVGLGDKGERYPDQLSGGEQGRVAIARAIVTNPSLLLADEPTGNLDSKTSKEIMDLFAALNKKGQTILFITHQLEFAAYGNRMLEMKDGSIAEGGFNEHAPYCF